MLNQKLTIIVDNKPTIKTNIVTFLREKQYEVMETIMVSLLLEI